MDVEFTSIWKVIGWEEDDPICEQGSHLLIIQFVCSLQEVDNGITFCLFEVEYILHLEKFRSTHRLPKKMLN